MSSRLDSIEQATLALGCVSRRTEAYSPWQEGKIERLNRTIEQELLQGLPGWTGGPRDVRSRLVEQDALDALAVRGRVR